MLQITFGDDPLRRLGGGEAAGGASQYYLSTSVTVTEFFPLKKKFKKFIPSKSYQKWI
jgi:hypothetical protein